MQRGYAGSAKIERDTRTEHLLSLTFTDDALSNIEEGDTVRLIIISRMGSAQVTLSSTALRRLLMGDPRARIERMETY